METIINKHFKDLENQAYSKNIPVFSEFLTLNEINIAKEMFPHDPCKIFTGGYENAVRRLIIFLPYEDCEYTSPVVCLKISPKNLKFRSMPEHRDFLGSILGLGIKREVVGDIFTDKDCAYVFCQINISEYILNNLKKVGSSPVDVGICEEIPAIAQNMKTIHATVPSERLDCICAEAFNLSRTGAAELIKKKLVFVNDIMTESVSYTLKPEDIVSVRHHGKFKYKGLSHVTKKERLSIIIERYQ